MEEIILKKYAIKDGSYVIEETTFTKDEAKTPHPSSIELVGQDGFWLLSSLSNQITDYDVSGKFQAKEPVEPSKGTLLADVTLITEAQYEQAQADMEAAKIQATADFNAAETQKLADREVVLLRIGVTQAELELFK